MTMNKLPRELKNEICNFLEDIDSINHLTLSKNMNPIKYIIKKYICIDQYKSLTNNKSGIDFIIRKAILTNYDDVHSYKITHLKFAYYINQTVDNLPTSINHLTFGNNFNQRVDNLPTSITHLTFGGCFNQ